jgi:hypothetical protein
VIYKRGEVYWYKFMWQGKLVRESSKQGNDKVARNMESAHRTSLAKGEVGIREPKKIPTLKQFCSDRVEPWAKSTFEKTTRKSWLWYRTGIRALTNHRPLGDTHLDEINGELSSNFASSLARRNAGQHGEQFTARFASHSQFGRGVGRPRQSAESEGAHRRTSPRARRYCRGRSEVSCRCS